MACQEKTAKVYIGAIHGASGNFPEITKERLFTWDPEVILVDDHGGSPGPVAKDLYDNSDWAQLQAVEKEQIYRIPAGVFFLDKGDPILLSWIL